MNEELIIIGKVVRTHGLKGAFRVALLTDIPNRFRGLERVILESPLGLRKQCTLTGVREEKSVSGDQVVVECMEIGSIEEAEPFVQGWVKIPRSQAASLPQNQYYHFDLIGSAVFLEDGRYLGILEEIFKTGSNDVFVVRQDQREHLIPAIKSVVKEVNTQEKRVILRRVEGLIEDDAV
jgi:16S rRNA processing protein RimM